MSSKRAVISSSVDSLGHVAPANMRPGTNFRRVGRKPHIVACLIIAFSFGAISKKFASYSLVWRNCGWATKKYKTVRLSAESYTNRNQSIRSITWVGPDCRLRSWPLSKRDECKEASRRPLPVASSSLTPLASRQWPFSFCNNCPPYRHAPP